MMHASSCSACCVLLKCILAAPTAVEHIEAPAQVPPLPTGCSGVALRLTVGASAWAYSPPPPPPTRNIFLVRVCGGGGGRVARAANTLRGRLCSLRPLASYAGPGGAEGPTNRHPTCAHIFATTLALFGCDFWAGTVVIALIKTSGSNFEFRVC